MRRKKNIIYDSLSKEQSTYQNTNRQRTDIKQIKKNQRSERHGKNHTPCNFFGFTICLFICFGWRNRKKERFHSNCKFASVFVSSQSSFVDWFETKISLEKCFSSELLVLFLDLKLIIASLSLSLRVLIPVLSLSLSIDTIHWFRCIHACDLHFSSSHFLRMHSPNRPNIAAIDVPFWVSNLEFMNVLNPIFGAALIAVVVVVVVCVLLQATDLYLEAIHLSLNDHVHFGAYFSLSSRFLLKISVLYPCLRNSKNLQCIRNWTDINYCQNDHGSLVKWHAIFFNIQI